MLGHLSFGVSDLARAIAFYDAVLAPLGYVRLWTEESGPGYGAAGTTNDKLALFQQTAEVRPPAAGFHLALVAPDREAVNEFTLRP
jgi:catechol 2,3-dioxygenase-like lactoylglutathione lyase family enzyme